LPAGVTGGAADLRECAAVFFELFSAFSQITGLRGRF
jgi:hypothetical protein